MAGALACPVRWWMYQLLLMMVYSRGHSGDAAGSDTSLTDITRVSATSQMPCGDDLCLCSHGRADCSGHWGNLTYVPRLPDDIVHVDLSRNSFSSDALTKHMFANLTNIIVLDLSYNSLSWLPRSLFEGMTKLTDLILDGNEELKLASLREMSSILTLLSITAQNCNLPPPPIDLFQNSTADVIQMSLNSNPHGGTYNLEGLCALPILLELNLRHCDFKEITSSCPLQRLSRLDLTGNTLRRFPKTCIRGKTSMFPALMFLYLMHNRIEVLSTAEICLSSLTHLDMSYNFIKSYPQRSFSIVKFPFLETLRLHHQTSYWDMFLVGTSIEDNAFDNPNLEELDLKNNELELADRKKIGGNAFANCHGLRELCLDSNNFTHVDDQRFFELLGHLRSLKALLISNSKFESISTQTFVYFPNLVSLFLHDNTIVAVPDGAFDSLRKLKILHLYDNKIQTINEGTFSKQVRQRLNTLTLGFNPFMCSCELLWFQHWFLIEQPELFRDHTVQKTDYRCHNLPGTTLANFSMTEQACMLSREVNLLVIECSSIVIFTLTLVSLVFRYRWYIRLLMYEVFRGRDDVRRQRLLTNNFDFDVFVSYASEDLPWVRQHLMAKLEGELGLKLCVHERDFMLGRHIVDNIVQCVESSKKILMVFSADFVRSQWCQFELTLCLSHVLDHDDALIVVCVDDVTSRHMTSAMMGVLKTTTYIQWREEEDAVASFWGRLHLALNEILPHGDLHV